MKTLYTSLFLIFWVVFFTAQETFKLQGKVVDVETKDGLFGASVFVIENGKGVSADLEGKYLLRLKKGVYQLKVSYVGYHDKVVSVDLNQNQTLDVELLSSSENLEEFILESERSNDNVENTDIGKVDLGIEEIKTIPQFMGEVDVIKTLQLMPGIQSGGEGNGAFYVRGGGPDQNLVLLDNVTVYNASHVLGFFSVFNGDMVDNISLTKGGIPANYGGRLASVIDVEQKTGDFEKIKVNGGIGLISSRLTVEGPIKKDKASFIFGARRTYIDVLTKPFIKPSAPAAGSGFYFYDLNGKISWRLGKNDVINVMGYYGKDKMTFKNSDSDFNIEIPWGNGAAGVNWTHSFNDRLFLKSDLTFTDYQFFFNGIQDEFSFQLTSGIRDYGGKTQINWIPNKKIYLRGGVDYIFHEFTPSSVSATSGDTEFDTGETQVLNAHEVGVYADNDHEINDWLKIRYGLRWSYFQQTGPFNRYIKDSVDRIIDTVKYDRGDNIADYNGFEPRISFRIKTGKTSSIKGGFTLNYQPIHLTTLSSVSLPTDTWIPSTSIVKPQFGTQYNLGVFKNFKKDMFETSIEGYYKRMNNLVEYKDGEGPDSGVNDNFDDYLTFGKGYSYGAEFFVRKTKGKFTGWIGYTISFTNRIFEELNNGDEFPAKYDRRHDLSVVLMYKLNEQWTVSTAFVYSSGNTMTVPESRYFVEGYPVSKYGPRNGYRLPDYNRLDFSATYNFKENKKKKNKKTGEITFVKRKLKQNIVISVYNIYNRYNPFFIYFDDEGSIIDGDFRIVAKQVSLFPLLPSVTWNFSF